MNSVELKRMKLHAIGRLDERLGDVFAIERQVEIVCDEISDGLLIRVSQPVLGREMKRVECRYPKDWWQAFKARWFPTWAKNKWPVEEKVVTLIARELYPYIAMPDARIDLEVK